MRKSRMSARVLLSLSRTLAGVLVLASCVACPGSG